MILTEGTTEMKMVVRYRTNNACVLQGHRENAAVIALAGVITSTMMSIMNDYY